MYSSAPGSAVPTSESWSNGELAPMDSTSSWMSPFFLKRDRTSNFMLERGLYCERGWEQKKSERSSVGPPKIWV